MKKLTTGDTAMLEAIELGYSIDKDGVIRNPDGVVLEGYVASYNGYKYRKINCKTGRFLASRFQALIKYGEFKLFKSSRIIVMHKDGNTLNNSYGNIYIGWHYEAHAHRKVKE